MKKTEKTINISQWWRSVPMLVCSVVAAAALLFLSGRAAFMVSAGENDITITFDTNGGSGSTPSMTVEIGDYFVLPDKNCGMTKNGYSLVRWSTTTDIIGDTYSVGNTVRFYEDTVLYAIWEKDLILTFDKNGADGNPPAPVIATAIDIGSYEYVTMPVAPEDMVKPGYRFVGWDTKPDGTGDRYYENQLFTNLTGDMTFYAQWQKLIIVSFDANGATGTVPDSYEDINSVSVDSFPAPSQLEKTGYEFVCWCTDPEQGPGSQNFSVGDYHTFSEDTVLYAIWFKKPTVTITYDANGGTGDVPPQDSGNSPYTFTAAVPPSSLVRPGYEFAAWNAQADGSGISNYYPGQQYTISEDLTLYAQWSKLLRVTYHANGATGSVPASYEVSDWSKITIAEPPSDLKKEGYGFAQWNTQPDKSGKPYDPGDTDTIISDLDLYAIWEPLITVIYDANGGTGPVPEPHVGIQPRLDVTIQPRPNDLKKKGFYFYSWNSQQTGYGVDYQPGDETYYVTDSTIYANWKYTTYQVTYDPNKDSIGGETVYPRDTPVTISYNCNSPEIDPETGLYTILSEERTTAGYHLLGWSTDPHATAPMTQLQINLDADTETVDYTLYAVWEEYQYNLSYSPGEDHDGVEVPAGGTYSYTDVKNGNVSLSTTLPAHEGYRFTGWKMLSSEIVYPVSDVEAGQNLTVGLISFDTERNAVAVAQWERLYHTVTYKPGTGGGTEQSDSYEYGTTVTVKDDSMFWAPFLGYEFDGWKCDKAGYSTTPGETITVKDNVTYTAQWRQIFYTLQYDKGEVPAATGLPATVSGITLPDLRAGEVYISETKPTAAGYLFTGWQIANADNAASKYYDATQFGNMTDNERRVEEALFDSTRTATAVAQWQEIYTVTYKDSENASAQYTDTGISGEYTLLGIADTGFTAPSGKTFDGWKLVTPDDKGYPATASAGDSIDVVSNVTYEAQWKPTDTPASTATITYTSGLTEDFPGYNESCATPFVVNDVPTTEEYAVLGNDPQSEGNPGFAPDGYTFAGWKLIPSTGSSPRPTAVSGGAGTDGLYHEGDTVATDDLASGSVTLKAMWNCQLRYDANGGTGTLPENGSDITQYVGDNVTVADGSDLKQGTMNFAYWSTSANDETGSTHYSPSSQFVIKDDTVLYAIYSDAPTPPDDTYSVTYNANGGTGDVPKDTKEYSAGDTVNVASKGDLARTGATFKEWNTKPDGSGTGYKGDGTDSFTITADTTLYAIWTDGNGKILPTPSTGESAAPMILAFSAAFLSLAAFAFLGIRGRRHKVNAEDR